ncbi:MAG: helix-turn-helix transcriptional regulator [Bacteroidetes bacterium]|nr:helix-turn-helix transcriptional regulator [Bacteroidota bacterium]
MNKVQNKIAELRKKKGYSQREFADLVGISHPLLIKFEKGDTDKAPISAANEMANLLDVSIFELFNLENRNTKEINFLKLLDEIEIDTKKLEKALFDKDKYISLLEKHLIRKSSDITNAGITASQLMNFFLLDHMKEIGLNETSKSSLFETMQAANFVALDDCFLKYLDTPEEKFKKEQGTEEPSKGKDKEIEYFRDALKEIRRFY